MATAARRNGTDDKRDAWLTLPQAARMLRVARHTLLSRALDGEIVTEVIAGRRLVLRESVEKALEAQHA